MPAPCSLSYPQLQWLDPVTSAEAGFRNKAKLVVGGSAKNPTLGIVDYRTGASTDLGECPLYMEPIQAAIPVLHELIQPVHLAANRHQKLLRTQHETHHQLARRRSRHQNILQLTATVRNVIGASNLRAESARAAPE